MDIFTFILSLLGAGAWIPFAIGYLKKSKFEFKLIYCNFMDNFTINLFNPDGEKIETKEKIQCLTLGFIITTYNKRHVIADIEVTINMKTGNKIKGIPHTKLLQFKNDDGTRGRLAIPGNMNILVNGDIAPDSAGIFYCNFIFEYPVAFIYDEIESFTVAITQSCPNEETRCIVLDNNAIMKAAHINYTADIYTITGNSANRSV